MIYFKSKHIIEYLEAEQTGALKKNQILKIWRWPKEANVYKAITAKSRARNIMEIDLKYRQKIEAYEGNIKIYIENISTIGKRNKVHTTQWRTI